MFLGVLRNRRSTYQIDPSTYWWLENKRGRFLQPVCIYDRCDTEKSSDPSNRRDCSSHVELIKSSLMAILRLWIRLNRCCVRLQAFSVRDRCLKLWTKIRCRMRRSCGIQAVWFSVNLPSFWFYMTSKLMQMYLSQGKKGVIKKHFNVVARD